RGAATPPVPGRHGGRAWAGSFGTPGAAGEFAPAGGAAHFYSQVDFDGHNELRGRPSDPLQLPGPGAPLRSAFPSFLRLDGDYGGYGNRSPVERRGHPLLYNVFRPSADDRRFSISNLEALLRHGDTGSQALASELARLAPA